MILTLLRRTNQGNVLRKVTEKDVDGRQNTFNTAKQMLKDLPLADNSAYYYRVDYGKLEFIART